MGAAATRSVESLVYFRPSSIQHTAVLVVDCSCDLTMLTASSCSQSHEDQRYNRHAAGQSIAGQSDTIVLQILVRTFSYFIAACYGMPVTSDHSILRHRSTAATIRRM